MDKKLIDTKWLILHDELSKMFYVDKKFNKEFFDKAHGTLWLLYEKECIENGVLPDYENLETKKRRSEEIMDTLAILKTEDVDALIKKLMENNVVNG